MLGPTWAVFWRALLLQFLIAVLAMHVVRFFVHEPALIVFYPSIGYAFAIVVTLVALYSFKLNVFTAIAGARLDWTPARQRQIVWGFVVVLAVLAVLDVYVGLMFNYAFFNTFVFYALLSGLAVLAVYFGFKVKRDRQAAPLL